MKQCCFTTKVINTCICYFSALPYQNKVSISDITITFVESHQPTKLLARLEKERGWTVEQRRAGIYIIHGDVVPIQIIDSRELPEAENLWLKGLDNKLDAQRLQRLDAEIDRCGNADQLRKCK
jgi:hypothetical protein